MCLCPRRRLRRGLEGKRREEKRERENSEKGIGGSSALRKVLCNADLPAAEEALLPPRLSRAGKLRSAASSSSVLSLSFALDAQFADALAHHTIVFAEDLGQAPWESLFGARRASSFLPVAAAPPWSPGHFYVRRPRLGASARCGQVSLHERLREQVHCPTRTAVSRTRP